MKRRAFLASTLLVCAWNAAAAGADYPEVRAGKALSFPRDHGSHAEFRTEWWYLTGWLRAADGRDLGMQITFFRNRPGIGEDNPSRFAPRQLLFAHAALSDVRIGRLLHDQRAAREGFGLASAGEGDTAVHIEDWSLKRVGEIYEARVLARDFDFALRFRPVQPLLLQGEGGYSRKGPAASQASYYYSWPHLDVAGTVTVGGKQTEVAGAAWLDHEWSSAVMAAGAVGWDWIGINLEGGGALMVFRMRDERGGTHWAGGTHRDRAGKLRVLRRAEIAFVPLRRWRSPRTQTEYPVAMRITTGIGDFLIEPSMDDQELDSRASTGTVYWEGAITARGPAGMAGRGYLELTGYWKPLKL